MNEWLICTIMALYTEACTIVRTNSFGHWTSGICESSMSIIGCVLAWCVSGLDNVTEDFGAEISKQLYLRYAVISSR